MPVDSEIISEIKKIAKKLSPNEQYGEQFGQNLEDKLYYLETDYLIKILDMVKLVQKYE